MRNYNSSSQEQSQLRTEPAALLTTNAKGWFKQHAAFSGRFALRRSVRLSTCCSSYHRVRQFMRCVIGKRTREKDCRNFAEAATGQLLSRDKDQKGEPCFFFYESRPNCSDTALFQHRRELTAWQGNGYRGLHSSCPLTLHGALSLRTITCRRKHISLQQNAPSKEGIVLPTYRWK